MLQKLHMKIKNRHPGKITMASLCCSPHLFVMQSSGPTKYHAVERAPNLWTCHLAIKRHTCAVDNCVQESKVQQFTLFYLLLSRIKEVQFNAGNVIIIGPHIQKCGKPSDISNISEVLVGHFYEQSLNNFLQSEFCLQNWRQSPFTLNNVTEMSDFVTCLIDEIKELQSIACVFVTSK